MICGQCEAEFEGNRCECGWTARVQPLMLHRALHQPGITLEEFGVDLFEAIKTASALTWTTKMRKAAADDPRPDRIELSLQNMRHREAALSKQLVLLTKRVGVDDQRRIAELLTQGG